MKIIPFLKIQKFSQRSTSSTYFILDVSYIGPDIMDKNPKKSAIYREATMFLEIFPKKKIPKTLILAFEVIE